MMDKEKKLEYHRAYYRNNKDKFKEYKKKKYDDDPERFRAKRREYSRTARALEVRSAYLKSKEGHVTSMLTQAKTRAKREGLQFELTRDDITIPDLCPLLGIQLVLDNNRQTKQSSPSLDRIDPTKGYVKTNVKVISHMANSMKRNASREQLLRFAANMKDYLE